MSTCYEELRHVDFQVALQEVKHELRRKSDSTVDGLSVKVRGTDRIIHADGTVTQGKALTDGQLQHRADTGVLAATVLGAATVLTTVVIMDDDGGILSFVSKEFKRLKW